MLGGSIALAAAAAASIAAVARAALCPRRPPPLALLGTAATALYGFAIRPWHLRWGAEPEDEKRGLPGDELLPKNGTRILHAVTIHAPVAEVWPWLAQLGQDRGGFYSYEWLENLAGCRMQTPTGSVPSGSDHAKSARRSSCIGDSACRSRSTRPVARSVSKAGAPSFSSPSTSSTHACSHAATASTGSLVS